MIGTTVSHYTIIEKLGEGGMGVVYKAHDTRLDREVALKFLPSNIAATGEDKQRFTREARAASTLDHPNICNVHEIDETPEGQLFIVMTIYEGTMLSKKIEKGPLAIDEAIDIAIQAGEGLQAAHEKGIVHRDIKSQNIMVTLKGQVKILDFGLAKLRGTSVVTKIGTTVGTMGYMSPEQLRGDSVDHRTDIWATGVVLYEMIAGRRPFEGDYDDAVSYQIINQQPEPLTAIRTGVPMELEAVVNKCLEKNPNDRYQHADELIVDLRRVRTRSSQTVPIPAPRSRSKRTVMFFAGAVVLLILLAFLGRGLFFGEPDKTISLAVLPLENLSSETGQDYFANGITDALITELGQIGALRVRSRTSILRYAKTDKTLPQIAKELSAEMVVEGSVSRSGETARITAKLIRAVDDRQIWTKTYERGIAKFLTLENEIARDIAREIGIRLTEEARERATNQKAVDPKAFDLYLKGVFSGNSEDFVEATKLDPEFGLAYAKIASAYFYSGLFGTMPALKAFSKMRDAAETALQKDNTLGEAHCFLALAKLHIDLDWVGAEKEFKRALELNPSLVDTRHFYAHYLMAANRIEESATEMKLTAELDPLSPDMNLCFGWHCLFTNDYKGAIELASKGVATDSSDGWSEVILGWSYERESRVQEAIAEFRKAVGHWQGGSIPLAGLAHAYAIAGDKKNARKILQQLLDAAKSKFIPAYDIAAIYAGLGEVDLSIEWLNKALVERSGFLVYIKCDRRFDQLLADPRFAAIIGQLHMPG